LAKQLAGSHGLHLFMKQQRESTPTKEAANSSKSATAKKNDV
jgi:hypothetical protein